MPAITNGGMNEIVKVINTNRNDHKESPKGGVVS